MSIRSFWRNFFFRLLFSFSILYRIIIRLLSKDFGKVDNTALYGSMGLCEENIFCQRKIIFLNKFWQFIKNFGVMSETLGNVVKTGLSVFIASFPGELFILKLFHFFHFRTLCGRIWVFCLKTSARLSKLRFTAPSGLFDEKMFCRLKILFLNVFWHFIKNIGFTAEIFG